MFMIKKFVKCDISRSELSILSASSI